MDGQLDHEGAWFTTREAGSPEGSEPSSGGVILTTHGSKRVDNSGSNITVLPTVYLHNHAMFSLSEK